MNRRILTGIPASLGLLFLILDAKTAIAGASDGVILCLRSVIPSLFPFFLLSILLTGALTGVALPLFRPIGKLCGIPEGGESLLLTGFLGGYPTGAQAIAQTYSAGNLTRQEARRLLGFCSNAGPSFLFGIIGNKFSDLRIVWALWLIHILSALTVGAILPGKSNRRILLQKGQGITVSEALQKSIRITATVCGWVVLFRVLLAICSRWWLWLLPDWAQVLTAGILELTNGCCDLDRVPSEELRFLICAIVLSQGGLCVLMQTLSVTGKPGLGLYIPGKLFQCAVSSTLALLAFPLLFGTKIPAVPLMIAGAISAAIGLFLQKAAKNSSNPAPIGV